MNKNQHDIERYLDRTMSPEESSEFELRLHKDPALMVELEEEQLARSVIREAGRLEMKNTLQQFEEDLPSAVAGSKVIPLWMKRTLPVAAMLIIFFGLYQVFTQNTMSSEAAFDTYFEQYAAPGVVRDGETPNLVNWKKATQFYSEGNYQQAAVFFDRAIGEVPAHQAEFYKGVSQLSMEAPYYQRAVESFDRVLETDNDFVQQARWFKALALIGMNNHAAAGPMLEEIVASQGYNHKNAAKLLKVNWKR